MKQPWRIRINAYPDSTTKRWYNISQTKHNKDRFIVSGIYSISSSEQKSFLLHWMPDSVCLPLPYRRGLIVIIYDLLCDLCVRVSNWWEIVAHQHRPLCLISDTPTVTSYWAPWRLLNRLFKRISKKTSKLRVTGRWIPLTKGQWRGKCFHLMTPSWQLKARRRKDWGSVISPAALQGRCAPCTDLVTRMSSGCAPTNTVPLHHNSLTNNSRFAQTQGGHPSDFVFISRQPRLP